MSETVYCPICKRKTAECTCYYVLKDKRYGSIRWSVVLDHLHLLSDAQIKHLQSIQSALAIKYNDEDYTEVLEQLEDENKNGI